MDAPRHPPVRPARRGGGRRLARRPPQTDDGSELQRHPGGEGAKRDPFEVLGLQGGKEGSKMEEATKARRKLALKWHPDRNIGNEEEATKKMQEINAAYNEVERMPLPAAMAMRTW
ncbi:hypothetical protein ACHAXT_010873 [Thalassiosira profunda]